MKTILSWVSAIMITSVAFGAGIAVVADEAAAHVCKRERGDSSDLDCDSSNCPEDGVNHVHIEHRPLWVDKKCCESGDSAQHDIGDQAEVGCFIGPNGEACYVTREWVFEGGRQVRYDKYYCYDEDGALKDVGYM